jgi:AcrR family transcriptional regulator
MARKPDPGARERILGVATRLFNAHGVHAVGLQQIIDELGCGKHLLYREFATKDDLVVAYLRRCRDDWTSIVEEASRAHTGDPAGQIVAIVRAIADRAIVAGHRGCPVHNTHAEFPEADHPAHRVSVEHFDAIRTQLHDLAKRAGAADPRTLADRIMLIIDGLNVNGATHGSQGAAAAAVPFAEDVVRSALAAGERREPGREPGREATTVTAGNRRRIRPE